MVTNASEKVTAVRVEKGVDGLTFETVPAGRAPLYHRYPGQVKPQGAFLELDAAGHVRADWNGEIGSAIPAEVYCRRVLRYKVPADLSGRGIAELFEHFRPLLARIHAGHSISWDGREMRGFLTADAQEAEDALEYGLYDMAPVDFDRDDTGFDEDEEEQDEAPATVSSLQELTGQESGIVVYYGETPAAVVCNWSSIDGLPRLSPIGGGVLGLGESIPRVEPETCESVAGFLEGIEVVYANGEDMPARARLFDLPAFNAAVLAPEGWA